MYYRKGTRVRCKWLPGIYKIVSYIPKTSKISKKEFRGKYSIILSSGYTFYASFEELTKLKHYP